jgi:hypothetical protein
MNILRSITSERWLENSPNKPKIIQNIKSNSSANNITKEKNETSSLKKSFFWKISFATDNHNTIENFPYFFLSFS